MKGYTCSGNEGSELIGSWGLRRHPYLQQIGNKVLVSMVCFGTKIVGNEVGVFWWNVLITYIRDNWGNEFCNIFSLRDPEFSAHGKYEPRTSVLHILKKSNSYLHLSQDCYLINTQISLKGKTLGMIFIPYNFSL